jgi:YfiH family protein
MEFENSKLEWLEFDLLKDYSHLVGGVFLRHGGVSVGAFSSLNMSDRVGDHPDSVKVNRSLMKQNLDVSHVVFAKQNHKNNIFEVTPDNLANIPQADALFTKEKDIALVITHADCQAAIFYDPKNEIIGVVHAGWRGLVLNVYKDMVEKFKEQGSKEEDIIVCVSPSIGPEHAEFKNYKNDFPKYFWDYQSKPFYFNLWEIAKKQLKECNILSSNIEIVEACTYSNPDEYYSYRREKITGRNATVIAMK